MVRQPPRVAVARARRRPRGPWVRAGLLCHEELPDRGQDGAGLAYQRSAAAAQKEDYLDRKIEATCGTFGEGVPGGRPSSQASQGAPRR